MSAVLQHNFINVDQTRQWLFNAPSMSSDLELRENPVILHRVHYQRTLGNMIIDQNTILFVLRGKTLFKSRDKIYEIGSGQMVSLTKGMLIEYDNVCGPAIDDHYEAIFFVVEDEILKEFISGIDLIRHKSAINDNAMLVNLVDAIMQAFLDSVKPLFNASQRINKGLTRLKVVELLYHVLRLDAGVILQMLSVRKQLPKDLITIIENHFMDPIGLKDLADLAGRSLSTFKREFDMLYKCAPAKWIKERRLEKANQLLQTTSMSIQMVTSVTGFENVSHFSRTFKRHFGYSPSKAQTSANSEGHLLQVV